MQMSIDYSGGDVVILLFAGEELFVVQQLTLAIVFK